MLEKTLAVAFWVIPIPLFGAFFGVLSVIADAG